MPTLRVFPILKKARPPRTAPGTPDRNPKIDDGRRSGCIRGDIGRVDGFKGLDNDVAHCAVGFLIGLGSAHVQQSGTVVSRLDIGPVERDGFGAARGRHLRDPGLVPY